MDKKNDGLAINNEAVVQIAGMAALEVDGVAGLDKRPAELRNIKSFLSGMRTGHSRSVDFTVDNGALILDVYINVKDTAKVQTVAESVQNNVKEKVQSMTGNAVARVNVHVEDLTVDTAG